MLFPGGMPVCNARGALNAEWNASACTYVFTGATSQLSRGSKLQSKAMPVSPPHDAAQVQAMHNAEQERRRVRREAASQPAAVEAPEEDAAPVLAAPALAPAERPSGFRFGRGGQVLTLAKAVQKVEAHDLFVQSGAGLHASIRRSLSVALLMPRPSQDLFQRTCSATIQNIPLNLVTQLFLCAGWQKVSETPTHTEFKTDYPKALGSVMELQTVQSVMGHASGKLYKPEREPQAKAVVQSAHRSPW